MSSSKAEDLADIAPGLEALSLREVMPAVYCELRSLASHCLRSERKNHTLQPTALVHEAFLRLLDQHAVDWDNRAQVIGVAAQLMRRVLSTHAKKRKAEKRAGNAAHVYLSDLPQEVLQGSGDVVALADLNLALDALSEADSRQGRIAELRLFGGLTSKEIAELLDMSVPTVDRDWASARLFLMHELRYGVNGARSHEHDP